MREPSKILFFVLILSVLSACTKQADKLTITCSLGISENELRIPLELTFSQECQYCIEYWSDKTEAVTTKEYSSLNGKGNATLIFLYPQTQYNYRVKAINADNEIAFCQGSFTTEALTFDVPKYTVVSKEEGFNPKGLIMQMSAENPGFITFCDIDGNVVWYERFDQAVRQATFDKRTNTILVNLGFRYGSTGVIQRVSEKSQMIDLFGNSLFEWKAGERYVDYPHHEIVRMDNGNILVLHNVVKTFDLTDSGGELNTDVFGEGISIFTPDGEQVWSWDCFDELDVLTDKTVNPVSNHQDLMHANSVCWDSKNNLYISYNRLNEIWKISYPEGEVLYRAKCNTDGIHALVNLDEDKLLCLDNGKKEKHSAAKIFEISENGEAQETMKIQFPEEYCSINRSNVDYHPELGWMMFCSTVRMGLVFTDFSGNVKAIIKREGISYRSYYFDSIEY